MSEDGRAQGTPKSESFFFGSRRTSPEDWGRLVEIKDEEEVGDVGEIGVVDVGDAVTRPEPEVPLFLFALLSSELKQGVIEL